MKTLLRNTQAQFWLLFVPTLLLFFLSLWMCIRLWYPEGLSNELLRIHFVTFAWIYSGWMLVFYMHGLMDFRTLRRFGRIAQVVSAAMLVNLILAVIFLYFQPYFLITPRRFLIINALLGYIFTVGWYAGIRYVLQTFFIEDLYVLKPQNIEFKSLFNYKDAMPLGYRILGNLTEGDLHPNKILNRAGLILPDISSDSGELIRKLYELRGLEVNFYSDKWFYEIVFRKVHPDALSHKWFIENVVYKESVIYQIFKRFMDLVFGSLAFVVFIITLPFIGLLIIFDSPGNIFYVQERIGKGGRVFKIYKYRTMRVQDGGIWTSENDPRITRIGKILRKLRIDELPQAINLLNGTMSLVGPRPEQVRIVDELIGIMPYFGERHVVKPGLTGWAQLHVYAGSVSESLEKLQYDLYYIKHRSSLFDLEIIIKTVYVLITGKGR